MRKVFLFLAGLIVGAAVFAQPTDNPYKTFYDQSGQHWTDNAIEWSVVTDVTTTNAVSEGTISDGRFPDANDGVFPDGATEITYVVDSANLVTVMQNISGTGGVLYFPSGKYLFDFDVYIPSDVVLRGETPPADKLDAKKNTFSPPTVFIFPKYLFVESGDGTANTTAFKRIQSASSFHNGGMVWLTINRAIINVLAHQDDFSQTITEEDEAPYVGSYDKPQPTTLRTHVILFGLRQTNAIEADANVPTGDQHDYQRWPNRRIGNINAFIYKNGIVSNNRLNDVEACANFGDGDPYNGDAQQPHFFGDEAATSYTNANYPIDSDDFYISVYLTSGGTQTTNPVLFSYNNKYGVNINRGKLYYKPSSYMTDWHGTLDHHTPETEPSSFGTNMEINDNWIFKTMRPAMQVGGLAVEVDRNVMRDNKAKNDDQPQEIHPAGAKFGQGATTYENRGMDLSGWDVSASDNWFEAYRSEVSGYLSTCGEGILHQESSGSALKGFTLKNNIGHNYVGLYKSKDIYNVNISGNKLVSGGSGLAGNIMILADVNAGDCSRPYPIHNIIVDSNEVNSLIVQGSFGGTNVFVRGNTTDGMKLSCYAEQEGNVDHEGNPWVNKNPAFGENLPQWMSTTTAEKYGDEDCTEYPDLDQLDEPCVNEGVYPSVEFDNPGQFPLTQEDVGTIETISFTAEQDGVSDFTGWFYKLFINFDIIEGELDPAGSASYDWEIPELNSYNITVEVIDTTSGTFTYNSEILKYALVTDVYNILVNESEYGDMQVYPNPTQNILYFNVNDGFENGEVSIYNNTGETVYRSLISSGNEGSIDVSKLTNGLYFISVSQDKKRVVKAFIKE